MELEASQTELIRQLEERLLQPEVRKSARDVADLLADEFIEIGSSGDVFNKKQIIESLQHEPMIRRSLMDFKTSRLASDVILATYRAIRHGAPGEGPGISLRNSIWKLINGRWQIIFHQGTLAREGLIQEGQPMATQSTPGIFPLLATIPYFQGVDPAMLQTIARSAFFKEYEPGELIFLEGEQAAGLYIVQEGWLKVSKIALDGREQILQLLGSGEVFNAIGVFTEQVNPASVTALELSKIWLIRRETMLKLLDTHPRFARVVIRDLAGRVLHLISLVEDLSLRTVEARLAKLLLESSEGDVIQRQRWANQNEIASRLGTVPDVVSRTMRRLSERGLIQIARHQIRIIDRAGLEAIARVEPGSS